MAVGIQPRIRSVVIINKAAGKAKSAAEKEAERIEELLTAGGVSTVVKPIEPYLLEEYATQMAHSDYDAVVAAGGDRTVHSVASVLVGTDKPLGITGLVSSISDKPGKFPEELGASF